MIASFDLANVDEVYDFPVNSIRFGENIQLNLHKIDDLNDVILHDVNLNDADRKANTVVKIEHDKFGLTCAFIVSLFHIVAYLSINIRQYRFVYRNKKVTKRHLTNSLVSTYNSSHDPENLYSPYDDIESIRYSSSSSSSPNSTTSSMISIIAAVRAKTNFMRNTDRKSRRSDRKSNNHSTISSIIPGSTWSATTSNFGTQRQT